jgi:AcrR family transcriptional regulator
MPTQRKLSQLRRTQILKATVETIGRQGLCDTKVADVAARAGTSAALLIYYFGTKDRLLAEALAYSEDAFYEQTERELALIEKATHRLARLVELSCAVGTSAEEPWLDEWVLWLDMWARAPRDPDVARDREAMDRRYRAVIAEIVRTGQARGEFDATVDVDEFSLRLAALIDGLAIQVVLGDPAVPPERMFEVCMRSAASELGFEWRTPRRRSKALAAGSRRA